jgi:hypothetical protein
MKNNQEIIKEFREKFVGVSNWRQDGFTVPFVRCYAEDLESFILQVRTDTIEETTNNVLAGKIEGFKTLTISETVNVIPELQEYFKKQGRTDTINEIRKESDNLLPDTGIMAASSISEQARFFIQGYGFCKEDIKTFLDKL